MGDVAEVLEAITNTGIPGSFMFEPERPITDHELESLSRQLRPYRFERDSDGHLLIMSPTSLRSARVSNLLAHFITSWALDTGLGTAFGANAGFKLPDGSLRSPDAAWIVLSPEAQADPASEVEYVKGCPDFVVEVRSPRDTIKSQKTKMQMWLRNGARLAWLIDPVDERVWVYQPDQPEVELQGFDRTLSEETVLPGFTLDLNRLRVGTVS
jgi:Uma2 family endonuclease